ncbi:MAG: hypothetical protein HYY16_03940 [Planctomycetes bacterium]|nr:hypothetical protein [Planctomycetota bacterium]
MTSKARPPRRTLDVVKDALAFSVADILKRSLMEVGRRVWPPVLLSAVALVFLAFGLVLLILGGMLGLRELDVPEWAAHAAVGAAAILCGALLLRLR